MHSVDLTSRVDSIFTNIDFRTIWYYSMRIHIRVISVPGAPDDITSHTRVGGFRGCNLLR